MPRRRSGTRALKSWTAAMRAALRLAGDAVAAGQRLGETARAQSRAASTKNAAAGQIGNEAAPARRRSADAARRTSTPAAPRWPPFPEAAQTGRFRNAFGTRAFRLYRPVAAPLPGTRAPLIVLLHGCAQDAMRFAATTRMPQRANARGCWVLCPEQARTAQRSRCWNWFEPAHQQRGSGEPAIVAGMIRKIVREHRLDPRRVFVAGLSAGGAMAVILGRTYPELFDGVGVCAGMPYAAARTATTAVLAMRGRHRSPVEAPGAGGSPIKPVRTIVVHGDRDRTVVPANADAIASEALAAFGATTAEHESGTSGGRSFERVRHRTPKGLVAVEHWTVHGAGHAWSGGAPGAFSDPRGPDASDVLLRFFLD